MSCAISLEFTCLATHRKHAPVIDSLPVAFIRARLNNRHDDYLVCLDFLVLPVDERFFVLILRAFLHKPVLLTGAQQPHPTCNAMPILYLSSYCQICGLRLDWCSTMHCESAFYGIGELKPLISGQYFLLLD